MNMYDAILDLLVEDPKMSYDEIAKKLGSTPISVSGYVYRMRRRGIRIPRRKYFDLLGVNWADLKEKAKKAGWEVGEGMK